ncbi:MAG: hypothetical protein VX712_01515 [Bacteroidota bacterium]|uniref:Uncharacterized protein n=1 Tax=Christiangramia flava JLT2011 TaxID=1229726 RepID=A0A1L7I6I3_9FLAO|nr:hypothetical protein [Christiangramia flava]APU69201.1 hypothetical protein GRFL_2477 [Christiangramia flava JLT2011]MAM19134.1 hypothetical protein [Christiangramia sp.]MEE2770865.1 hypothetical protein [Bacteroidota bacterium]OSS38899.1 membrane protein [Christiangramia flava JLT2011]
MSENATENQPVKNKNIWNLVLGILFLGYGAFRLWQKTQMEETDTFGVLLSLVLIGIGIYDLYKYFKGV